MVYNSILQAIGNTPLIKLNRMVDSDMAKVASEDAAMKVRHNLVEYLEKGIVK